ncbi:Tyrosine recombinase XerA [Frankliniella fusca]|uniref:Tyrosine recombinase XerA n=1 Tax=Frankliniella fusca TaxID=407009 RepID=A0AAE1I3T5_9NEOP|nr:Tyrosine recombinase XerA [Frankliniella fusca]
MVFWLQNYVIFFFVSQTVLWYGTIFESATISETFSYGPNTWRFLECVLQNFYENVFCCKFNFQQDLFYSFQRYLCQFRRNMCAEVVFFVGL